MFVLGENHFRKCFFVNASVWLVWKIEFSGNQFQLTIKNTLWPRKFIFVPIFTSNEFRRERESERKKRANPELPSSSTIAGEPRAPIRRSHAPVAPVSLIAAPRRSHRAARSRLQSRLRAISPSTHWSLSLCDFDFYVILIFVVVAVVWWWCFGGCGFWLPEFATVGWIAMWKICKKIAFSTI